MCAVTSEELQAVIAVPTPVTPGHRNALLYGIQTYKNQIMDTASIGRTSFDVPGQVCITPDPCTMLLYASPTVCHGTLQGATGYSQP